jgi:uncharacterized repeat protein (TIGR01451 family)
MKINSNHFLAAVSGLGFTALLVVGWFAFQNTLAVVTRVEVVSPNPDFSASSKTDDDADNIVGIGQAITYEITITNTGNATGTGVDVDDTIDADATNLRNVALAGCGTSFTDSSTGAQLNVDNLEITRTEDCVIQYTVDVAAGAGDGATIPNDVEISAADEGGIGTTVSGDTMTVEVPEPPTEPEPDLSTSTKGDSDADNIVAPGDIITYTIRVKNTGLGGASGVNIDDIVDAETANLRNVILTDCGNVATDHSTSGVLDVNNLAIAAGAECIVHYTVDVKATASDGATIDNIAAISAPLEGGSGANPASATITVDVPAEPPPPTEEPPTEPEPGSTPPEQPSETGEQAASDADRLEELEDEEQALEDELEGAEGEEADQIEEELEDVRDEQEEVLQELLELLDDMVEAGEFIPEEVVDAVVDAFLEGTLPLETLTDNQRQVIAERINEQTLLDLISDQLVTSRQLINLRIPPEQTSIRLGGRAVPNSNVHLQLCTNEIQQVETVLTDATGNWATEVPSDALGTGKQTVVAETEVAGLSTGRKIIGNFLNLKEARIDRTFLLIIANLIVVLVISQIVVYLVWRKQLLQEVKKQKLGAVALRLGITACALVVALIIILYSLFPVQPQKEARFTASLDLPDLEITSVNGRPVEPGETLTFTDEEVLVLRGTGKPSVLVSFTVCDGVESYSFAVADNGEWVLAIPVNEIPNDDVVFSAAVTDDETGQTTETEFVDIEVTDRERGAPNWLVILLLIAIIFLANKFEWDLLRLRQERQGTGEPKGPQPAKPLEVEPIAKILAEVEKNVAEGKGGAALAEEKPAEKKTEPPAKGGGALGV